MTSNKQTYTQPLPSREAGQGSLSLEHHNKLIHVNVKRTSVSVDKTDIRGKRPQLSPAIRQAQTKNVIMQNKNSTKSQKSEIDLVDLTKMKQEDEGAAGGPDHPPSDTFPEDRNHDEPKNLEGQKESQPEQDKKRTAAVAPLQNNSTNNSTKRPVILAIAPSEHMEPKQPRPATGTTVAMLSHLSRYRSEGGTGKHRGAPPKSTRGATPTVDAKTPTHPRQKK